MLWKITKKKIRFRRHTHQKSRHRRGIRRPWTTQDSTFPVFQQDHLFRKTHTTAPFPFDKIITIEAI